jgi:hypothetical protein
MIIIEIQVLGGMARRPAADGLQALGYVGVQPLNSQDLLFTITSAGRAALAATAAVGRPRARSGSVPFP